MTSGRPFSVIIPTHERHDLLRNALSSVLGQDAGMVGEIVVVTDVDDRSLPELVSRTVGGMVPHRVLRAPSTGASAARNAGVAASRLEYIAFLDDDDVWSSRYLAMIEPLLGTADLVGSRSILLDRRGGVIFPPGFSGRARRSRIRLSWQLYGSSIAVTRAAFEGLGGFDESLRIYNDRDLVFRAVREGKVVHVLDEVLVERLWHDGPQLSRRPIDEVAGIDAFRSKHQAVLSAWQLRRLKAERGRVRAGAATSSRERQLARLLVLLADPSFAVDRARQRVSLMLWRFRRRRLLRARRGASSRWGRMA